MIQVVRSGWIWAVLRALLGVLACADAGAVCGDRSYPGCDGTGESGEWRVEFVDVVNTEHPSYFRVRTTSKLKGASATWRIPTDSFGGDVRAIQVYRSRALVISYATRGFYHIALLDLAKQEQVASFLAWGLNRSPDDRYLLYRIAHSARGPWDPRVFLLDLQDVDHKARIGGSGTNPGMIAHAGMKVGTPVYELPERTGYPKVDHERRAVDFGHPHYVSDLVWDLKRERLLLILPDNEEKPSLVALSLSKEITEPTCRVPVHATGAQGEFSVSLHRTAFDLNYEPADDVAVIKIKDKNGVRPDFRVSLTEACAGQAEP